MTSQRLTLDLPDDNSSIAARLRELADQVDSDRFQLPNVYERRFFFSGSGRCIGTIEGMN